MKPITNILLALALVCYVFLPFYNISFQGGLSGFEFTAGTISRNPSLIGISFALLPFISSFLAMGFNCLKNKYWSIASAVLIVLGIYFFVIATNFHQFSLNHSPEITPTNDLGEGFSIAGIGMGFILSCTLMSLALVSALVSLLPFKFNEAIERAVDDTLDKTWEEGRKHIKALGHEVHDEWNKIEAKSKQHLHHNTHPANHTTHVTPDEKLTETTPPPIPEDKEDESRFMPGNNA